MEIDLRELSVVERGIVVRTLLKYVSVSHSRKSPSGFKNP